jgi:LemA protein
MTIAIIVVVALVVIAVLYFIVKRNSIIAARNRVDESWSGIDVQLKRRHDLVPNLVETVKGYAKHEKELFENLANARTKYFQAPTPQGKIAASQQLDGLLSRLLVLQENYPQLKANEGFLKLQDSLEGTENRIAVERKRYNDDVNALNTYRRTVFGRFFASLAGVGEAAYYEVPVAEKEAPKVKFQ